MITRGLLTQDLDYVLEQARTELLGYRDKEILITGASGLLGFWIAAVILEANSRYDLNLHITVTSRLESDPKKLGFYLQGDPIKVHVIDLFGISKFPLKSEIFFDIIFHTAISNNKNSDFSNLNKDLNLIKLFTNQSELTCSSIYFPSSGAVYGRQPLDLNRIPENLETNLKFGPLTQYGEFKDTAEKILKKHASGQSINLITPRIFTLYGPKLPLDKQFAIGNFVGMAKRGLQIEINGNQNSKRSYLYMADFVIWTLKALRLNISQSIHIGSDEIVTISELANIISEKFECEFAPKILDQNSKASNYIPSTADTRLLLGVDNQITFSNGLDRWILWLKVSDQMRAE